MIQLKTVNCLINSFQGLLKYLTILCLNIIFLTKEIVLTYLFQYIHSLGINNIVFMIYII